MIGRDLVLVCVIHTVVVSVLWMALPRGIRDSRSADYRHFYEPVARNLIGGRGLTTADGEPAVRYPPGHVVVLAGAYSTARVLRLPESVVLGAISVLFHVATSVLVFRLTRQVFTLSVAWIASLMWSCYLPALYIEVLLNSELSFIPLLLLTINQFCHPRESMISRRLLPGALLGVAMLIRPAAIGLPLVFGLAGTLATNQSWGRRLAGAALLCLGTFVVILPWQLWMRHHTQQSHALSSGGLPSIVDGLTFNRSSSLRETLAVPSAVAAVTADLEARQRAGEITSMTTLLGWFGKQLGARPLAMGQLLCIKAARSWYGTDSHRLEGSLLLGQIPYLVLAIIGTYSALRSGGPKRGFAILSCGIVGYFWLMTVLVLSILRYMLPAMPFIVILASLPLAAATTYCFAYCGQLSHVSEKANDEH